MSSGLDDGRGDNANDEGEPDSEGDDNDADDVPDDGDKDAKDDEGDNEQVWATTVVKMTSDDGSTKSTMI